MFRAKRADRLKMIWWDGTGLVLAYKRLEQHVFKWPAIKDGVLRLDAAQFEALLGNLYPRLTDISGRCLPEDVGGFPGYDEFVEAIANPKHPEHANLKEWYGGPFDPSTPPADELRLEVLKLAKRWKPKNTLN